MIDEEEFKKFLDSPDSRRLKPITPLHNTLDKRELRDNKPIG